MEEKLPFPFTPRKSPIRGLSTHPEHPRGVGARPQSLGRGQKKE